MVYNFVRITRRHYGTNASWPRQDHARRASVHTAIESFERGAEPETGDQRQNRCQVARARYRGRCPDGAEAGAFNGSFDRTRGRDRRGLPPHPATFG